MLILTRKPEQSIVLTYGADAWVVTVVKVHRDQVRVTLRVETGTADSKSYTIQAPESISVGPMKVRLAEIRGRQVRLGFDGPRECRVMRSEIVAKAA